MNKRWLQPSSSQSCERDHTPEWQENRTGVCQGFAKSTREHGVGERGLEKPQLQQDLRLPWSAPVLPRGWNVTQGLGRHTCTRLFSGIEVMVLKLVLSFSKHAGTYLSKRIVKLAFSDWCCLLSIQLATYLKKNTEKLWTLSCKTEFH